MMIDVTVKTLDGQNRSFSVPENITVKQFKEKIANSINIPADTQRLIFQGKVLHDEKLLKDYDVHGKVVHVVLRPPPSTGRPAGTDNPTPSTVPPRDPNSVVVGSFTLPSDVIDAGMVQNIAQDAIRSMGDLGRNARVSTRTSTDGSAVDVHIHLGPVHTGGTHSEAQMRLNTAQQMMRLATEALNQLENPGAATGSSTSSSSAPRQEPASEREAEPSSQTTGEPVSVTSTSSTQSSPTPMETEETRVSSEQETSAGSTQATTGSSSSTNQNSQPSTSSQSADSTQNGSQQPRGPVRPNISALGDVLTELSALNLRLQPHIEHFREIVTNDAEMNQNEQRENQRACNMVSEAMHGMSHAYHAISDLMVDLSQNRPRQLYVTLAIAHPHTAVIQQSIPVQAQIQVGGSPLSIRRQFGPRATATATLRTATPVSSATASVPVSQSSTTSTGTSTGPLPSTTETGTQSNEARSQQAAGTQHDAGLSEDDMQRIQQQMSAGLQSVLGQQGLQQGNGTPENPYVFVEMGPDSMTVNSISAEVVTSSDPGHDEHDHPLPTATPPSATTMPSSQTAPQGQQGSSPGQPGQQGQGVLPPNFLQDLIQQIVVQSGPGQAGRTQINIGQGVPPGMMGGPPGMMGGPPGMMGGPPGMMGGPPGMMGPAGMMGMPIGIRLGPRVVRPGVPGAGAQQNESATQTAGGVPANSGTQTSATPTNASGTQTANTTTPSNTSGTQTAPRAAAFVVPGMPGLAQNISPVDPYLPCSSRHFLSQHAQGIINQGPQNSDTALADMVSNLMSGLLGGRTGAPTSGTATTSTAGSTPSTAAPGTTTTTTGPPLRPTGFRLGMPGSMPGQVFTLGAMPPNVAGGLFRARGTPFRLPGMQGRFPVGRGQPRAGNQPSTSPQQPTGAPQGSATTTQGAQQGTDGAGGSEPQFLQMLRSMLSTANQQVSPSNTAAASSATTTTTTSTTSSTSSTQSSESTTPETGGAGRQPITDEAFTQLVGGITGYMSQAAMGQAPRQTIADFLGGLGENYTMPQGEGFINDVLSCVLSNLQITDLVSVFYGQPTPLNQVQAPLREFISTRVLDDSPPFPDTIRASVDRLVESMQPDLVDTVNAAQPRPHIDFLETLNRFFNINFYNLILLIMNARENDTHFGQDVYAYVRRMLAELLVLSSRCLGGMEAVQQMVNHRMQSLTSGVNPFIQNWMSSMTLRQVEAFIPTINITEGEVSFYIVYKSVGQPSASSEASATPKTPVTQPTSKPSAPPAAAQSPAVGSSSGAKRDSSPLRAPSPKRVSKPAVVPKEKTNGQPMEISSPVSTTSPGASEVDTSNSKASPAREVKGAASADSTSRSVRNTDNQSSGAQAAGNDWQSVVPAEWVPVITRDIETQRRQSAQRPHSDVYLQGMPPKRRRLMTQDRPQNDLSNTSEVLPESIRRAVAAAAVEPISSMENLTSELGNDSELQEAFQSQINSTLSERLESDKDFKNDRFPNTEEYYHKSDNKK